MREEGASRSGRDRIGDAGSRAAGAAAARVGRLARSSRQQTVVRLPTAAEVDAVVTTLTELGQQPAESLTSTTAANGAVGMDLGGGFAGILLARPAENGTWETRCVFTVEEGAEFLGLVEDVQ